MRMFVSWLVRVSPIIVGVSTTTTMGLYVIITIVVIVIIASSGWHGSNDAHTHTQIHTHPSTHMVRGGRGGTTSGAAATATVDNAQ